MAALDFASNHLALEPVLIAHLRASVPTLHEVGGPAEFDRILLDIDEANPAVYPVAYCRYAGPDAGQPVGSGHAARRVDQVWHVFIIAQTDLSAVDTTHAHPGEVLADVLSAMKTFRPDGVIRVAEVPPGNDAVIYGVGEVFFTLAYQFTFQL